MKYFLGHIWKSVFEHSMGIFLSSIDRPVESLQIAVLLFAKLLMAGACYTKTLNRVSRVASQCRDYRHELHALYRVVFREWVAVCCPSTCSVPVLLTPHFCSTNNSCTVLKKLTQFKYLYIFVKLWLPFPDSFSPFCNKCGSSHAYAISHLHNQVWFLLVELMDAGGGHVSCECVNCQCAPLF